MKTRIIHRVISITIQPIPMGDRIMEKYTFTFEEEIVVSSTIEDRQAKQGTSVTVKFLFTDWTANELALRLMSSNSPKVSVQAILRKMKDIPSRYEYNVPKPGTRAVADPAQTLINKYDGDIDAIIAMLEARKAGK